MNKHKIMITIDGLDFQQSVEEANNLCYDSIESIKKASNISYIRRAVSKFLSKLL